MAAVRRSEVRARRVAAAALRAAPPGQPWSVREWAERLGDLRGRPIELVPVPYRRGGPVGAWHRGPDADLIGVIEQTTPAHQDVIVLHELGHLLCGHRGACLARDDVRELAPGASLRLVNHLLGREDARGEELEAENIARIVWQHVASTATTLDARREGQARRTAPLLEAFTLGR